MITENQVDKIVEKLIERMEQANTKFLKSIGSSIKEIRKLTPTQAQQLVQILKYGGKYENIVKELAKYTDLNIKDIDEIFKQYAKKDQMFYKDFYDYRNKPFIPFEENVILQRQTQALANMVKNKIYDFTRSNVLGYSIDGEFVGLRDTYNRLLDEALMNVGQGKETFDQAMSGILKEIGGSGLRTVVYDSTYIDKNGKLKHRTMRLDSAIRMELKSDLRELHNENQKIIGEEIGADGVEITVHENPADDHEEVQGRQFSNEEFIKLQNGEIAKDYKGINRQLGHSKSGSYRPISELNCYHRIFEIVLGVNKPRYDDKQLQQIINDNHKGFEFEGKHYTNYEGTQLQRNLERAIREQKDTQILAVSSDNKGLISKSQDNIRILTNKYKQLSEVSGLPTKMQRMKVSGYKRIKVTTKTPKTNYKDYFKEYWNKSDDEKFANIVAVDDLFEKRYEPIYSQWDNETKNAFKNYTGPYYKDINKTLLGEKLDDTDNWIGLKGVHSADDYKLEINKWINSMDNEINKNPINENIVLWKGTEAKYYKDFKPGDEFSLDMYFSTSLDRSVAETFMWNKDGAVALKINCPASTKGMYLSGEYGLGEAEMLLGRKQKLKILRTYEEYGTSSNLKNKKIKIIELEVMK